MSSRRRRSRDHAASDEPAAFRPMTRAYRPIDVLSAEEEARVHALSLRVLSEIGLKFLSPETWPILEKAGCRVERESGMVYFPPEVVEHFLALAPAQFTLKAPNPANDLIFGDAHIHYGSASSAPNALDRERGRRPGSQADFEALVKLNQMLPTCAFHCGHPVEPIDTPPNTRHLTSGRAWATLSDKAARVYGIGRTRVEDALALIEVAQGLDRNGLRAAPRVQSVLNINSPLVVDAPLIEGAMALAENNQIVVVSPVALAGAMSPITLSGSLIQCNAEVIGAIAFLQMVRAGAPCFYGVLTSPVDMKSGAPALGVPEGVTGTLANGQMARRYRIPQRVWLGSTSVAPDAQSAWETMFSLWAAQLSGAHAVFHAHGWMEGGLTTGFEKTVLDSDMIGMMGALAPTIDLSDAEEAIEAIRQVGPGGHFLGSDHTMARYETAFHRPALSDWRAYEFWQSDGAKDAAARATERWKAMLEAYAPPPMDPGRLEAIDAFVARRTVEIGKVEI